MKVAPADDPVVNAKSTEIISSQASLILNEISRVSRLATYIIHATIGQMKHRYEPRKVRKDAAEYVSFHGTVENAY